MNLNKSFVLGLGLCAVSATLAVACADGEDASTGSTAGSAGTTQGGAGKAGSSGTAGSAGTAGKATGGSSGSGGTAGTAGAAGTAGKAGSSGTAGTSGASGNAGTGGSTAGAGGSTAGAGGSSAGAGGSSAGAGGSSAGAGGSGGAGGGATTASLSVAHLSIDAGEVKVCAGPTGTTQGVDALATFTGGGITKLAFKDVTAHIPNIPAATYDFSLVDAADTCPSAGTPLIEVKNVTLDAGAAYTVMAIGAKASLKVVVAKDTTTPDSSNGLVRFVHAASALPIPVDLGAMLPTYTPVWTNAAFGAVATTATFGIDANGYVTVPAMAGYVFGVGASPVTSPTFLSGQVPVDMTEIATLYAIDSGGAVPAAGLKCHEAPNSAVLLIPCTLVPLAPPAP